MGYVFHPWGCHFLPWSSTCVYNWESGTTVFTMRWGSIWLTFLIFLHVLGNTLTSMMRSDFPYMNLKWAVQSPPFVLASVFYSHSWWSAMHNIFIYFFVMRRCGQMDTRSSFELIYFIVVITYLLKRVSIDIYTLEVPPRQTEEDCSAFIRPCVGQHKIKNAV